MNVKISPSLLASDLSALACETVKMEKGGADMIHLDVMDGHFVPNITFGAPVVKGLRDKSALIFDTHLMIDRPDKYAENFIEAGADIITFHTEAKCDIGKTIEYIKASGAGAGLAIKPFTGPEVLYPYMDVLDMVLVMTVEPGFGGQAFMENMLDKVKKLREYAVEKGLSLDIQVDGGINSSTGLLAAEAGANVFVAGTSLFGADDYKKAVSLLRSSCENGFKRWVNG